MTDVKSYVSIGPREDMAITLDKDTFDTGFIALTILFVFGLLLISGLTIYFAYQQTSLPPPPPPLQPLTSIDMSLHSNYGSTSSEQEILDKCNPPFFGPNCSIEKHDRNYYAVGTPNPSDMKLSIINNIFTNRKSFTEDSCSSQCDNTDECVGFIYQNNVCTLLKDNIISESVIPYSKYKNSTLYLKSSDNLHFEHKIFLGAYIHSLPPRYWLVKDTPHYLQLSPNEISKLIFYPTYFKSYNLYTGIYCIHPFTHKDIPILLNRNEGVYIHHPNTNLELPSSWKHRILYVAYI